MRAIPQYFILLLEKTMNQKTLYKPTMTKEDLKGVNFAQLVLFCMLVCFCQSAFAETASLSSIFVNGQDAWKAIMTLTNVTAFVAGIAIGAAALLKLKEVSDGKQSIKVPIMWTMVSAALIAIPSTMGTFMSTLTNEGYHGNNLLSQVSDDSGIPGVADAMKGVLLFIQMLGNIAFFRGLILLKHAGSGKEGMLKSGLFFLFGGAAAINVQTTVGILARTFFTGMTLPMGIGSW